MSLNSPVGLKRSKKRRVVVVSSESEESTGCEEASESECSFVNDEASEEGGSFGDFLGCIFAMGSTEADICPDISTSCQLCLCIRIESSGSLTGLALSSAATVERNIGQKVKPGLYLTNAEVYDLDMMVDAEPKLEGLLWEAIEGDDSELKLFPVSKLYQTYLYAIQQSEADRFFSVVEAIPVIKAGIGHLDFGVNQPESHTRLVVDALRSGRPKTMRPKHQICSGCRTQKACTVQVGDLAFGKDCGSRLAKALPYIKAAERLTSEIISPFDFEYLIEKL